MGVPRKATQTSKGPEGRRGEEVLPWVSQLEMAVTGWKNQGAGSSLPFAAFLLVAVSLIGPTENCWGFARSCSFHTFEPQEPITYFISTNSYLINNPENLLVFTSLPCQAGSPQEAGGTLRSRRFGTLSWRTRTPSCGGRGARGALSSPEPGVTLRRANSARRRHSCGKDASEETETSRSPTPLSLAGAPIQGHQLKCRTK